MKIFVVCTRLCYGGAERVGVLLANGLARRGHEVTVVANLLDDITYQLDGNIRKLPLVSTNKNKLKKWIGAFPLMRRHLKRYRPDVVVGILNTTSLVAKVAGIGLGIPVVMTEHDAFERPESAPFGFWKWFAKFQLNKIYGCVTVLTEADRRVIGIRLRHVRVMPNPLALEPVKEIPKKKKVILAAGRLDSWHYKGFDVLIRSYAQSRAMLKKNDNGVDSVSDWRLQIAGTGSEESLSYLKELCREQGVEDRVDFLGFREDIEMLYRQAEIFVLSSRYEGFGMVLVEAMSQGCACVACDYKGRQREIIQDDTQGLCCEPDNVDALAQAMLRMMEDEDYRRTVQKNAVERSRYYELSNVAERWEELLHENCLSD